MLRSADNTIPHIDLLGLKDRVANALVRDLGAIDGPEGIEGNVAQNVLRIAVTESGDLRAGEIGVAQVHQLKNCGNLRS